MINFGENRASSLVTLEQGDNWMVLDRELGSITQRGTRPSLMKSLRLTQTFLEAGDRPNVPDVALLFISGQPSNVIGCLKYANEVRSAGVKLITVALTNKVVDGELHHEALEASERDFFNFLGTVAGTPEAVHVLNVNDPDCKFFFQKLEI